MNQHGDATRGDAASANTEAVMRRNWLGGRSHTRGSSPGTARDRMLVLLAAAAGCVDAVSYLGLGGVLTAAMTGNTILLGLAIGQAKIQAALRSCVALIGFMAGAAVAAAITGRGTTHAVWPRGVTLVLAIELAVLVALALGWHFAGEDVAYKGRSPGYAHRCSRDRDGDAERGCAAPRCGGGCDHVCDRYVDEFSGAAGRVAACAAQRDCRTIHRF
jgi:hypothetical protein